MHDESQGPASEVVADFVVLLAELPDSVADAERIDRIRQLEGLTAACAAAQAREIAGFTRRREQRLARAGDPHTIRASTVRQVALARQESPTRAARHVDLARMLTEDLPLVPVAMGAGEVTEWQATLVAREASVSPQPTVPGWTPNSPAPSALRRPGPARRSEGRTSPRRRTRRDQGGQGESCSSPA